jgi:hypothetical protein
MRLAVKKTTVLLAVVIVGLVALQYGVRNTLAAWHETGEIYRVSSDAVVYVKSYEQAYYKLDYSQYWDRGLFLRSWPIIFLKVANGDIYGVLLFNLGVMAASLYLAIKNISSHTGRIFFLLGSFVFPYFTFGFLAINKEIYTIASAVFFAIYYLNGRIRYLLLSLLFAWFARYFMVASILFVFCVFPRDRRPRYWLAVVSLIGISFVGPVIKRHIPGYSGGEQILDSAGKTGALFVHIIDWYGYALLYPFKYFLLIPMRIWSLVSGLGRAQDPMEAVVSVVTLGAIFCASAVYIRSKGDSIDHMRIRNFVMMGFLAPIPIMWTEITHWRYYSFVYFFFLFAIALRFKRRQLFCPAPQPA